MSKLLNTRALTEVLSQANTDGVTCSLLLTQGGALLAYSGYDVRDAKITAALASSIWSANKTSGENALHQDQVSFVVIDCEEGQLAITQVAKLLVCLKAANDVPIGLLRAKLHAVASYLEVPLLAISNIETQSFA